MIVEFRFLILALSVYRLAELVAIDDGPDKIFPRIKAFFGKRAHNKVMREIALLLDCPFCLGIWFSIILIPLVAYPTVAGDIFLLVFGAAGVQTFLEQISNAR